MSVLYLVLPLALGIAVMSVWAFIWMVRDEQLDDLDTPAIRILHDNSSTDRPQSQQHRAAGKKPS